MKLLIKPGDVYITKGGWKAQVLYVWNDGTYNPGVLCLHYIPYKDHKALCDDFSTYPHSLHEWGLNGWDEACLCIHDGKCFEGFMGNGEDQIPTKHYANNPTVLNLLKKVKSK